jgi:alpha-tubulin suppressor-like RCC1 family protein
MLDDHTVRCWGANDRGQLGDGTVVSRFEPMPVAELSDVIWIDAGAAHACAARRDGTVWCWGSNQYGQLGNGRFMENRTTPVRVEGLP